MTWPNMDLLEKLNNVKDRDTFLVFVKAIIENWEKEQEEIIRQKKLNIYDPRQFPFEWENQTIGWFLEAASAWGEVEKEERMPDNPTWRTFAEFLYAGKVYQ